MKKLVKGIIVLCFIGILAGLFIGFGYFENSNNDTNSNTYDVKRTKVSLDDENIKFLTDLTLETYYFKQIIDNETNEEVISESLFTDKKVNVASLSTNFKMSMALSTIKLDAYTNTVSKESMVAAYKKVFGTEDVADSFKSLLAGNHGDFVLDGENYKWDRIEWDADGYSGKHLPYEAYQYDDRIEIDYIFANSNLGNSDKIEYYAKDNKTVVFSYNSGNMDFDDDQAIIDNQDKFQHYLGIYMKSDDGNYYITSVEPKK